MALARVALRNLQQRVTQQAPTACRNYVFRPHVGSNYVGGTGFGPGLGSVQEQGWKYGLLQRFSTSGASSEGNEVAVQSDDQGGRKGSKWKSLLPRRLRKNNNLLRRRDTRDLDPFDMFPVGNLGNALLEAAENMNRVFDNMIPSQMMAAPSQLMGKFKETNDSYKLKYEMPGLTKDDLKVTVDNGVLRIRGERKVEEDDAGDEHWMSYGYYNTSLVLPDDAKQDDVKAELKDGVLVITIPKTESHGKDVREVQIH